MSEQTLTQTLVSTLISLSSPLKLTSLPTSLFTLAAVHCIYTQRRITRLSQQLTTL